MDGYSFTWSGGTHLIQDFSVPAETAVILASKQARHKAGIKEDQIYDLGIDCGRCLKQGWSLKGELIDFSEKHPAKRGNWAERESFQRYKHKNPEGYYYGRANDISSPGYYEQAIPLAPRLLVKKFVMWATLKKE